MLYCLLYYRGLGLVVVASLIVAGVDHLRHGAGARARPPASPSPCPASPGLIVAVGITADSFIVYFERIRDEMRDGKSMRVAVETGWARARNTCLAADAVSLLAAVVLYIFAIGVVRGFAFALGHQHPDRPRRVLLVHQAGDDPPGPGAVLQQRAAASPGSPARHSASTRAARTHSWQGGPDGQAQHDSATRSTRATSRSTSSAASGSGTPSPGVIVLLAVAWPLLQGPQLRHRVRGRRRVQRQPCRAGEATQDNVDKIRDAVADTGIDARLLADREHLRHDSIRVQTEVLTTDEADTRSPTRSPRRSTSTPRTTSPPRTSARAGASRSPSAP